MSNTWNQSGTTWGQNQWGDQADIDVTLTGVQSTSSVGAISPAQVMGLTGVQATSSVDDAGLILKYYGTLTPKTSTGYTIKTPA